MVVEVEQKKFSHVNRQRFGGYLAWWAFYFKSFGMVNTTTVNLHPNHKALKTRFYIRMILMFWWYLLLKPMGCVFSYKTTKNGFYEKVNGVFRTLNGRKNTVYYIFGIPMVTLSSPLSEKDLQ